MQLGIQAPPCCLLNVLPNVFLFRTPNGAIFLFWKLLFTIATIRPPIRLDFSHFFLYDFIKAYIWKYWFALAGTEWAEEMVEILFCSELNDFLFILFFRSLLEWKCILQTPTHSLYQTKKKSFAKKLLFTQLKWMAREHWTYYILYDDLIWIENDFISLRVSECHHLNESNVYVRFAVKCCLLLHDENGRTASIIHISYCFLFVERAESTNSNHASAQSVFSFVSE